MKKISDQFRNDIAHLVEKTFFLFFGALISGLLFPGIYKTQISYTFTNCGATGQFGPTQTQVNGSYTGANPLTGLVTVAGQGIQQWVVPNTGQYRIQAWGARGGAANSYTHFGRGASMEGVFTLTSGQVLKIMVGQQGAQGTYGGSGGGGSFVANNSNNIPLIVAGGGSGGGNYTSPNFAIMDGRITSYGPNYQSTGRATAGGGAGSYSVSGINANGGGSFISGGVGGALGGVGGGLGGFGGGAGSSGSNYYAAGAGGYSGGDEIMGTTVYMANEGGGGSYNSGTNQVNAAGLSVGHGSVIITVLCNITLNNTGVNPICSGNSATLTTNAISNYAWSTGGTSSSIVVSPTVTTIYTLSATSPSNCTASAAITVSVDNTPTVTAVISPSVVCANKPVTMTATGASSYTWTGGITNGVAYTPTLNGSYIYTVTGSNACGNSIAVVALTVNPAPIITAAINNPTVCSGNSIVLTGGGSVSGYTWSAGVPDSTPFVPAATTNYIVTGVGSNGCTNTAAIGVTVLITPTVTPVVTPTSVCLGGTATLIATGATGYTWTPGSNPNTSTIAVSPPGPTTYTVFRTNGACSSTGTVNLVVFPLPLMNASASPSQICAGTGANLVILGPITNTWLPGGFTMANFTVYPNFSVNYTVTGSNGNCTATAIVPIVVNPSPTITISSSTNTICEGNNVTLTGSGGLSYTWQPQNTNNLIEVVSPNATVLYTLSGSNSFNCVGSVNQLILVNPLPNVNLTSSLPFVCQGQVSQISLTNPSSGVTYSWNTGVLGTSISPNPTVSTNYFVTGTNTATGCQNTNSITLSVYISTFAVTSPTAICKGEIATLSAVGSATNYVWNINGGIVAPSVTVAPVINTTYSVTGSNGSCSNMQSASIIVNPIPNVVGVTAKSQICRFEISTITGNGATSYSWNTGAITPTISFNLSITTTYTLTGTDINGCSKTTTVTQFVATCIGIDEQNGTDNTLNIFPNPNNGEFTIQSQSAVNIKILNELGQVVRTANLSGTETLLNVTDLARGIYTVVAEKKGNVTSRKLIIQ